MSARFYTRPAVGDVVETETGPAIVQKVRKRGSVAVVRDLLGNVYEAVRIDGFWTVWA